MLSDLLQLRIKDLPDLPGVYIMHDEHGHILYIGKAISLKNRVRQYFGSPKNKTDKVLIMVSKIVDFDYIITHNEIEALVLENNLIKKHKPPYNILLKDDKSYPFIKISIKEKFPKVEVVRKLKKDGAKYFGPYMQGVNSRDILELIYSAFCLRSCGLNMNKIPASHRPCLNYHIQRCLAPCCGKVSHERYMQELDSALKFLNGNDKQIATILENKMAAASNDMEFELAIFYRDKIKVLEKLIRKQVTALANDSDMDIMAIISDDINTVVAVLFVRGGKLVGGDKQVISGGALSCEIAMSTYMFDFYDNLPHIPDIILTNIEPEGKQELVDYFSKKGDGRVNILIPIQGVRRQLLDMAENNAKDYLEKCVSEQERKENMTIGSITVLSERLGLSSIPYRMECFDISHTGGSDMVASMVVFINGEAYRKHYRKFKIKTVLDNNDYACMQEVLSRRLKELRGQDASFSSRPDLIVIDGGGGQLKYAQEAMVSCGEQIEMIALAERDEDIYTASGEVIKLNKRNQGLMVLQRLRDEAHRFAVTYHSDQRKKRQTKSKLSDIEGIGEKRIKMLYTHFKTLANIKGASVEELVKVKGMNISVANAIYNYFRGNDEIQNDSQ